MSGRSTGILLATLCVASMMPACGGGQRAVRHDNPHARALEAALRAGSPVDRDLFAAPVEIEGEQDWEALSSARDSGEAWYHLMGRLYGGRLHVDEITVEQGAVDKILRPGHKGNVKKSPPTAYFGTGYTIVGLPPEFAFWLALADLYREAAVESRQTIDRRGFGTIKHHQTSKAQGRDSSGGQHSDLAATRDLIQFRASHDVECAGQLKRFQIDEKTYVSPADLAEARLHREERGRKSMESRREALGLGGGAKGQLSWRMGQEEGGSWVLRIHLAHDAQLAKAKGEVLDESLLCRSSKPLVAAELPGYLRRVQPADAGTWKIEVWRGGKMPPPRRAAAPVPRVPRNPSVTPRLPTGPTKVTPMTPRPRARPTTGNRRRGPES